MGLQKSCSGGYITNHDQARPSLRAVGVATADEGLALARASHAKTVHSLMEVLVAANLVCIY